MTGPRPIAATGWPGSTASAVPSREAIGRLHHAQARVAELERLVGQQQVDLDFFSASLAAHRRGQPEQHRARLYAIIEAMIGAEAQGTPKGVATIERLCRIGGVSRAGYYRR